MSATNAFETALLGLIFNGTNITGIADDTASSPVATYYISLHTSDPGETGDQTTGETTYTGYSRLAITRDTDGWTVSGGTAVNVTELAFGLCTASPGGNLTHVGIGTAISGAGSLLFKPALDNPITMQVGTTPIFSAGELDITCD